MSCGQIDNRVSFQIAEAQTKLAHSSKREAVSQKVIAVLGTVFLPGAYLSVRVLSTHSTLTSSTNKYTNIQLVPLQHDILQLAIQQPKRALRLTTLLDLLGSHNSLDNRSRGLLRPLGSETVYESPQRGRSDRIADAGDEEEFPESNCKEWGYYEFKICVDSESINSWTWRCEGQW